jgi:hypothetical protein
VVAPEVVGVQEEEDAPARLAPDGGLFLFVLGLRKEKPRSH